MNPLSSSACFLMNCIEIFEYNQQYQTKTETQRTVVNINDRSLLYLFLAFCSSNYLSNIKLTGYTISSLMQRLI